MPLWRRALYGNWLPPIGADLPLRLLPQSSRSAVRRLAQLPFSGLFFYLRRTHEASLVGRGREDLLRPVRHDAYVPLRRGSRLRLRDGSEPGRSGGVPSHSPCVDRGRDQLGQGERRTATVRAGRLSRLVMLATSENAPSPTLGE